MGATIERLAIAAVLVKKLTRRKRLLLVQWLRRLLLVMSIRVVKLPVMYQLRIEVV